MFFFHLCREELVEYYERLSEEAAAREQRAMWHVRRGKLELARIAFMQREEEKLKQEMEAYTASLQPQVGFFVLHRTQG